MKKRKWKKTALVCGLAILTGIVLDSCRFGKTEVVFTSPLSKDDVFSINDEVCSLSKARVFLTNYQNLYGTAYGVNLWEHDFGDNSLEKYIKDLTVSQLAQIISMNFLAEQQGITLSDEEKAQVEKAAKAYYRSLTKEEIHYMNIDEACIRDLYQKYGLANKLYAHLTTGINDEVSDDEARIMEAYQIYVTSKERAKEVSEALNNGTDFLTLAGSYNEASSAEITFGRGDMPKEVEEAAFALESGKISNAIKTEEGYYFIKCINNYNQELTDENKQVILERRRKEAFDDVYDAFVETLSSKYNEELWNSVEIKIDEEIQTKGFFKTYEEYCKW